MKFTKRTIAGAIAGTVLAGGAAYAAITLTATGSAQADAYVARSLTVSGSQFSSQVYPGVSANLSFKVSNPNPFKVDIKSVAIANPRDLSVTCAPGEAKYLSGPAANVSGSTYTFPEGKIPQVPAGTEAAPGEQTVVIPGALNLSNDATQGCTVNVTFVVTGASSGN